MSANLRAGETGTIVMVVVFFSVLVLMILGVVAAKRMMIRKN